MRKASIVVAVAVLAAVLLVILLPRVVSLDSLKPRIVALLEEKTGRKVSFSKISLSLFPGIGVKVVGLTVSGDPGHAGENLLSVPEAEIRVAILPLLSGRAEFGKLLLRGPEVVFRRYRDGTHSATQIIDRIAPEEGKAAPPPEEKISVVLRALSIEQGKLTLILEGGDRGETRWRIDPFTLRLSGIGGTRNEFEIKTRIDGAIRGEIDFAGSLAREEGTAAGPAAFRLAGKGKVFAQPVTADGKVSMPAGPAQLDVSVSFPKIDVAKLRGIFARPPAMFSEVSLKGEAALAIRISGNLEAMGVSADLRYAPLAAAARATLAPSKGSREWSATARIASLSDLAGSLGGEFSKWEPEGRLAVAARGRRPSETARETWTASIDLDDVGAHLVEQKMRLRQLKGNVEIADGKVDFRPFSGSVNGQSFTIRGPVSLGPPAPAEPVSLKMASLDLDALFPPEEPGKQADKKKKPAAAAGKEAEGKGIAARGEIRIDAGKGRGLEFRDLAGSGRYEDGTLFLDSLSVRLYGGTATVSGRIRLAGDAPDFQVKAAAKEVSVGEILSRKTTLKDFFSGNASLSADVRGGAKDFEDFSRTAAGSGSFRVTDGKIKGVDLLGAAADRTGLAPVLQQGPQSKRIGTGETSFSDLSADFRIEGGKIRTDSLRIVSDKMSLVGPAAIGFDRSVDFRGTLTLSKELSERTRGVGGQYLTGRSGRVEVPLLISGNVTSPSVAVDREALARGAAEKALDRLKGRLPGAPPSSGEEQGKPPGRTDPGALEGLFDKLLPRKK